jgi:hypothetical protein
MAFFLRLNIRAQKNPHVILAGKSGSYVSSDFLTEGGPRVSLVGMVLKGVKGLEMVKYDEIGAEYVTVQVALLNHLAVPLTVEREIFWGFSEQERHQWLERSARTLLDIYGDARDGRVLSDYEVQQRAAA